MKNAKEYWYMKIKKNIFLTYEQAYNYEDLYVGMYTVLTLKALTFCLDKPWRTKFFLNHHSCLS